MTTLIDICGVQGRGILTNNMGAANAIRAVEHAVVSTHSGVLAVPSSKNHRRRLRRFSSLLGLAEIVTGG